MSRINDFIPVILFLAAIAILRLFGTEYVSGGLFLVALVSSGLRFWGGRWQLLPLMLAIFIHALTLVFDFTGYGPAFWMGVILTMISLFLLVSFPIPLLPRPTGNNQIGFGVFEFENHRWDSRQRKTEASKKLQAYIWYPATEVTQVEGRPYHDKKEASAFGMGLKKTAGLGFLYSHFRFTHTNSIKDAKMAAGSHPVLLFNHGGVMWPTQNLSLMEAFASQGYVVISLLHPGETAGVVWKDGAIEPISDETVSLMKPSKSDLQTYACYLLEQDLEEKVKYLPELVGIYHSSNSAITRDWSTDSSACLDWLERDAPEWLRTGVDPKKLAIGGMSIGGSTAFHACHNDNRWKAGFNLDGVNWAFELAGKNCPVPFFYCYSDLDLMQLKLGSIAGVVDKPSLEYAQDLTLFNDLFSSKDSENPENQIRLMWRGASHMSFTDCVLASRGFARKLTDTGKVSPQRFVSQLNHICFQFVDGALDPSKGIDAMELLAGKSDDEVLHLVA